MRLAAPFTRQARSSRAMFPMNNNDSPQLPRILPLPGSEAPGSAAAKHNPRERLRAGRVYAREVPKARLSAPLRTGTYCELLSNG
jgi:hypothetical protein